VAVRITGARFCECLIGTSPRREYHFIMSRFSKLITPCLVLALCAVACLGFTQDDAPPQIKAALKHTDDAIATIIAVPSDKRTFDNTVGAIDDLLVKLDDETSMFVFMQNVSPDANTRDQARSADEAVSNWQTEMGKREDLYRAVKAYADTHPKLEGEQERLLKFMMRDYHRAGMDLAPDKRDQLKKIELEMNKLGIQFEQNIADDETSVPLTGAELKGVPSDVLGKLKQSNGLYIVTMDAPTFNAVMDYDDNEAGRQRAWLEYKRRGGSKNVKVLEKLIKLRAQQASLLGYATTADFETEPRMAKNAATVAKFYADLQPVVRKKSKLDYDQFLAEKRKHTGDKATMLYPWDYSYYKNLLSKEKYSVDNEKVAEYFPMDQAVQGLFGVSQSLYGITYKDVTSQASALNMPIWAPDVKLYQVDDNTTHNTLGYFFLDMFPREGKYSHFATWGLISRKRWPDGTVQKPVAALVCNFTKPTDTKPSLLPHDEVETLFHEFGHCLHNILTTANYGRFAGAAVERDFVEAPSQMFENWVWSPDVLKTFARHYKTHEVLPEKLLSGMLAARYLGSGMEAEHQFYYALVDQKYHTAPEGNVDTTKLAMDLYPEVELYPKIPGTYFQSSFGHLVGYEAAYYGYMWSLVYAQDMFQRFKELGLLNPKAGMYYREKILARGGTMDAMDMVRDYLGREPTMEPFLVHLGLTVEKKK
jgi:thimet oligopeptidase